MTISNYLRNYFCLCFKVTAIKFNTNNNTTSLYAFKLAINDNCKKNVSKHVCVFPGESSFLLVCLMLKLRFLTKCGETHSFPVCQHGLLILSVNFVLNWFFCLSMHPLRLHANALVWTAATCSVGKQLLVGLAHSPQPQDSFFMQH